MYEMVEIDGREGEGGGQIVRTSVALSAITARPLRIIRVRANRKKPGLQPQHLAAVKAVATVCRAETEGLSVGAERFRFVPGRPQPGNYRFEVKTAGSACLVLHAVLPVLALASGRSSVVLTGGTHNDRAPPFDHVAKAFLPALAAMGLRAQLRLQRPGFYPKGGGEMALELEPWDEARPFVRVEPVDEAEVSATAHVGRLPEHVARRAEAYLSQAGFRIEISPAPSSSVGPGFAVCLHRSAPGAGEVVTGFGVRGTPAEQVIDGAVAELDALARSRMPVGPHLADQLLLYLALGAGGRFRACGQPSLHVQTQVKTIARFLGARVTTTPVEGGFEAKVDGAAKVLSGV